MALSYTEYTADGSTTNYTTPKYLQEAHLVVTVEGTPTTDYTLAGESLTFNTAPPTGSIIRIGRNSNQTARLTDYVDGSLLTADVMDADAKQLFFIAQEAIDTASETNLGVQKFYNASATAPASPAIGDLWYDTYNKYLKIYNGTQWDLATPSNETYTFDNTSFLVDGSYNYINVVNLTEDAFVFLNGVKQVRTTTQADVLVASGGDYYLDLTNNRVYFAPLAAADVVEITIAPSDLGINNNTQLETFTSTAGQTVFDLTKSYVPSTNTLHVYVNGIRQSAYEETSSTRVTFTNGLSAGDEVTFIINQYVKTSVSSAGKLAVFDTVAEMKNSEIVEGLLVTTQGYYTPGDGGGATYLTAVSQVVDGYGDHALANGNVALLQTDGTVNVKQFGAVGDGSTDDQPAAAACISYAVTNGLSVYWPASDQPYLLARDGYQIRELTMTKDFVMYGDGITSKIKRADNTAAGDFRETFFFRNQTGSQIKITVRDLFIDDNASGSTAPPSSFDYEHSHCITIQPLGARGVTEVRFENITIKDPVADGVSVGGSAINYVGDVICSGIRVFDRNRVRSDITVTASFDNVLVTNCSLTKFEIETNSVAADSLGNLELNNVVTSEYFEASFSTRATPATINNLTATGFFYLEGFNATVSNSSITIDEDARLLGNQDNTIIFNGVQFNTDAAMTDDRYLFIGSAATSPLTVLFNNCTFRNDGANASLTDYWDNTNTAFAGSYVEFKGCSFVCPTGMNQALFNRSGEWAVIDCDFYGAIGNDAFIQESTASLSIAHSFRAFNNRVHEAGKFLYQPATSVTNPPMTIYMKGNSAVDGAGSIIYFTTYANIASPRGAGSLLDFKEVDSFESDGSPTTGRYVRGTRVYEMAPSAAGKIGYVATTSGTGTGATFKPFGAIDA